MTINAVAVIILLGGWFFARVFEKIRLPGVLGMVVFGILCSVTIKDRAPHILWEIAPFLKSLALIVILLRAGLGISRANLKKAGKTALFMTFVPCIFEGTALIFILRYLFDFSLPVAGLTGFMLAAVSPAVIVPTMLDLKQKGYGRANEVPTIILAGASADDVFAITIFSAFLGQIVNKQSEFMASLVSIPFSIIAGIFLGAILGYILVVWLEKKYHSIRATEKTLILLSCAIFLAEVGDWVHVAALLGVMTIGYIMLQKSEKVAHEIAAKLGKIWAFAEIILFVLIGFSVDVNVAAQAGLKGILAIAAGLVFRSLGVLVATSASRLNMKERLFCVIAYLPKATVQAALGSVALNNGVSEGETILAIAVLAIVFTAPLGLFAIRIWGKRLLNLEI
ncbi:sodium:proton antiporter [Erysipelotrichia bacterium]|jgi:NhaP-type Na+/H+ or K+/H+ antiporter